MKLVVNAISMQYPFNAKDIDANSRVSAVIKDDYYRDMSKEKEIQ